MHKYMYPDLRCQFPSGSWRRFSLGPWRSSPSGPRPPSPVGGAIVHEGRRTQYHCLKILAKAVSIVEDSLDNRLCARRGPVIKAVRGEQLLQNRVDKLIMKLYHSVKSNFSDTSMSLSRAKHASPPLPSRIRSLLIQLDALVTLHRP